MPKWNISPKDYITFASMSPKRSVISFLLLFVYAISFGHSLVPHCHTDDISFPKNANDHHVFHHPHIVDVNGNEGNVLHENHLDANLLDYVICVLSEFEHGKEQVVHEAHSEVQTRDVGFSSACLPETFATCCLSIELADQASCPAEFGVHFYQTDFDSTPHRGPPFLG